MGQYKSPGPVLVFLSGIADADPFSGGHTTIETIVLHPKFFPKDTSTVQFTCDLQRFGQFSRTDCASVFTLTAGNADWEQSWEIEGFSSGYLGVFADNKSVEWIRVSVKERFLYGTNGIDRLSPELWAINYDRKVKSK